MDGNDGTWPSGYNGPGWDPNKRYGEPMRLSDIIKKLNGRLVDYILLIKPASLATSGFMVWSALREAKLTCWLVVLLM